MNLAPDLKAALSELAERLEHVSDYEHMLARARIPVPGPRHARDRHGLHVVRGLALPGAALMGMARWLAVGKLHKVATAVTALTVAGGAVAAPQVIPAIMQAPAAVVHHHHRRHAPPPAAPQAAPPTVIYPHWMRRRRRHHGPQVHRVPPPVPKPVPTQPFGPLPSLPPTPSPDPSPTLTPSPGPSGTPAPQPSPGAVSVWGFPPGGGGLAMAWHITAAAAAGPRTGRSRGRVFPGAPPP